jgi:hypothetical protein
MLVLIVLVALNIERGSIMDGIVVVVCALVGIFVAWTMLCLVLKGMFKIADKIFGN